MSPVRLCPKHGKPFPCGKCRIESAQKPAQTAVAVESQAPARRRLAGSFLNPSEKPKPPRKVLLHFCFDQNNGAKPESCTCHEHVPLEQAMEFVKREWADWLLTKNSKTGKLIRNTKAVVVRRVVINGEIVFPVPRKLDAGELEKVERNKQEIRGEVRSLLQTCFSDGYVPQTVVRMNDEQLDGLLNNARECEEFSRVLPRRLHRKLLELITRWWDEVRGYRKHKNKIDEDRFKNWDVDASEAGRRVQSEYYLNLAEQLAGSRDRTDQVYENYYREIARPIARRVRTANFRPHFWNGGWSYGKGVDPRRFESVDPRRFENYPPRSTMG